MYVLIFCFLCFLSPRIEISVHALLFRRTVYCEFLRTYVRTYVCMSVYLCECVSVWVCVCVYICWGGKSRRLFSWLRSAPSKVPLFALSLSLSLSRTFRRHHRSSPQTSFTHFPWTERVVGWPGRREAASSLTEAPPPDSRFPHRHGSARRRRRRTAADQQRRRPGRFWSDERRVYIRFRRSKWTRLDRESSSRFHGKMTPEIRTLFA